MNESVHSELKELHPKLRLLLLPGMDGTGELFSNFINSMPPWVSSKIVGYPKGTSLSFEDLVPIVRSALPTPEPFVILAESFSTPIAVQLAADSKVNLQGLVICAGFIRPPIQGLLCRFLSALAPLFFRLRPPAIAIRTFLLGRDAPLDLVQNVRTAIASVSPKVLAHRLRMVLACDVTKRASTITVPVLYLQAANDRLVGQSAFEVIKRVMPKVQLTTVSGPHLILQREPQAAFDAILPFLARICQWRRPDPSAPTSS